MTRTHRRRSGEDAQAALETALVLPILFGVVSVFIAVMLTVQAQQELDTATALAAESAFQARSTDHTTAAAYSQRSFNGTMQFYSTLLQWQAQPGAPAGAHVWCRGDYLGTPPAFDMPAPSTHAIECSSSATLRLDRSPVAFAALISPTLHARVIALPPPLRAP